MDTSQLEAALVNAHQAGDTQAASLLASEIQRIRSGGGYNGPKINLEGDNEFVKGAAPVVASPLGRFMKGYGDPAVGAAQLLSRATPHASALGIDEKLFDSMESGYEKARQMEGQDTSGIDAARLVGNVASPMNRLVPGKGVKAAVGQGAAIGAMQPVTGDDYWEQKVLQTVAGGVAGGVIPGISKVTGGAARKVAQIEANNATKAAADAAGETATARSAAGRAAQDAYKQLEHLRELGATRNLTAQEAQVVAELEKELGEKAAQKLLPAAAEKEATSAAYTAARQTESQRAADLAAQRLSGKEVKNQVMARVKRYGPAVAGGIAGNMIFPGLGGMVGGAATGLTLRPAVRSMLNLAKNPAVQHKVLSPVAKTNKLAQALLKKQPHITPSAALLVNALLQPSQ